MSLNPLQRNKVDMSSMTEEEQKLFRLYGKLPAKKNVVKHNLMERKYFDSGDYALSKAGKTAPQSVGTAIPSPENIPHASPPSNGTLPLATGPNPTNTASPTKDSGLGKETSEATEPDS